jgi:hypothetical protein
MTACALGSSAGAAI